MQKEVHYEDLPDRPPQEKEDEIFEQSHFNQIPEEEEHFSEPKPYPENYDPESERTWIQQFTAETEIRNYLLTRIRVGDMKIEIRQDGNSKAAVLVDPNTLESRSEVYDRSKHSDQAPVIPYQKAKKIVEEFYEQRSLTQTWAHEKRKERNWSNQLPEKDFTPTELEIFALNQLARDSFNTTLGDILLANKNKLEEKHKRHEPGRQPTEKEKVQDNIPW